MVPTNHQSPLERSQADENEFDFQLSNGIRGVGPRDVKKAPHKATGAEWQVGRRSAGQTLRSKGVDFPEERPPSLRKLLCGGGGSLWDGSGHTLPD